jgi:hypothetical protein
MMPLLPGELRAINLQPRAGINASSITGFQTPTANESVGRHNSEENMMSWLLLCIFCSSRISPGLGPYNGHLNHLAHDKSSDVKCW